MKKVFFLVSCFAVVLILSKVSVAQEVVACPAAPCPCVATGQTWMAPPWAVPYFHPGLSINPRDTRRMVRLEGRIATQQMRIQMRHAMPELQTYPFMPVGCPTQLVDMSMDDVGTKAFGYSSGPIAQTGRVNTSIQRVSANNTPVINFLSIGRGGGVIRQPVVPVY